MTLKIAVLSGKGGTGKTFVAVNLATAIPNSIYLDCDVEEPNGNLFFRTDIITTEIVRVKVPTVDQAKCNGCRQCVEFCKFNALAHIGNQLMIFDQICHSCGGCTLVCPEDALKEVDKPVGRVEIGRYGNRTIISGIMDPGEESGVPIITHLFKQINAQNRTQIIDCPAGSSCTVIESIQDVDYCLLVTEPTRLSLDNLKMVYELASLLNKPCGIVINKYSNTSNPIEQFCVANNIPILSKIDFDLRLAEICARGIIAVEDNENYQVAFSSLHQAILKEINT